MKAASRDGVSNQEALGHSCKSRVKLGARHQPGEEPAGWREEAGQLWPPWQGASGAGGCSADRQRSGRQRAYRSRARKTGQGHTLGLIASKSWDRKQLYISLGLPGLTS